MRMEQRKDSPLTLLQKGHAWYWYSTTFCGSRSVGGRSLALASAAATVAKVREKDTAPATPAGTTLEDGGGRRGGGTSEAHDRAPAAAGGTAPWSGRTERRERKARVCAARSDLIVLAETEVARREGECGGLLARHCPRCSIWARGFSSDAANESELDR